MAVDEDAHSVNNVDFLVNFHVKKIYTPALRYLRNVYCENMEGGPVNSFERLVIRSLVYQILDDKEGLYYATALELNITVSAKDSRTAKATLDEQIGEYITATQDNDAPELLNQEVDKEMEQLWKNYLKKK